MTSGLYQFFSVAFVPLQHGLRFKSEMTKPNNKISTNGLH